jgi:hypothetical protein
VTGPRPHPPAVFPLTASGREPALEAYAQSAAVGDWSEPLRTRVGWAVVKVVHVERVTAPDNLESRITAALTAQRRRDEERRLLAELREDTPIEVRASWVSQTAGP